MNRKRTRRTDEAVSPVIGVLLMLVVTIIIAAVVSGFAGGLAGSEKSAPSITLDVQADSSTGKITFEHLGGDQINTKDLEIITYYSNKTGTEFRKTTTKSSSEGEVYPAGSDGHGNSWTAGVTRVPYLADMSRTGGMKNADVAWFGNYTLKMGDLMSTYGNNGTTYLIGCDASTDANFSSGEEIDLKIKHIPSGKMIYDKEVPIR